MSKTATPARGSAQDIIKLCGALVLVLRSLVRDAVGRLRPEPRDPPPARSAPIAGKSRQKPALSRAGAGPEPGPTQVEVAEVIKASPLLAALAIAGNAGAASRSARHRPEHVAPQLCGNAVSPKHERAVVLHLPAVRALSIRQTSPANEQRSRGRAA